MTNEQKAQWCEALRSGRYLQTKNKLRNKGFYCCFGVLCDLVDPSGWTGDRSHRNNSFLPGSEVAAMVGLKDVCPSLPFRDRKGNEFHIASLNDSDFTFCQIADVIERFY